MVPGIENKSIAQIARERNTDEWDTWLDIIAEDPHTRGATGQLLPRDCYLQYYTHPRGMVGLDTRIADTKYQAKNPPYGFPGINTFSAYPMFLIKYVRDGRTFTIEEAVQKTSTMPAKVHNLEGRGILKEGNFADITLIDLPNLEVLSDEIETRRHPKGIEYVFINGEAVVERGIHTGATPGKVLKKT
jgi:N-acyl-D-amino-acid deacylase